MRLIMTLVGLCAAIGCAAPAQGAPDNGGAGDDSAFLAALQQADIGYSNPTQAVGSAKAVCTCLNSGESGLELVHDVAIRNPAFNMDAASQFAVISARYYCPQQLSRS